MNSGTHIIKKQILEISLPSDKGSFELQGKISKICNQNLLPLLNTLFTKLSPDEEYHQFDRLELNLGLISSDNIQNELVDKTLVQLEEILSNKIESRKTETKKFEENKRTQTEDLSGDVLKNDLLVNRQKHSDLEEVQNLKEHSSDSEQRKLKMLFHYLQHGSMPWWGLSYDIKTLCIEMVEQQTSFSLNSGMLVTLSPLLKRNPQASHRLVNLLSEKQLVMMSDRLSPVINQWVKVLVDHIFKVWPEIALTHNALIKMLWAFTLGWGAVNTFKTFREGLDLKSDSSQELVKQAILYLVKESPESKLPDQYASLLEASKDQLKILPTSSSEDQITQVTNFTPEQDEYYIQNSGLVLLWPFLSSYYSSLGLSDKQSLTDPSLAVGLLHYMENASSPTSEQDLVLNKILCGLPVNAVVELHDSFKEDQCKEADDLLNAVIKHWSALKSVSPDWLRAVFIKRDGVLRRRDNHWLLQVEYSPPDVLLDKLPWAISTVALPWMDHILIVEWS